MQALLVRLDRLASVVRPMTPIRRSGGADHDLADGGQRANHYFRVTDHD